MYSRFFNYILNYQTVPNIQLVIEQYSELPAGYSQLAVYLAVYSINSQVRMYRWLFNSIFSYQPVPNVQQVIQQYIKQPAGYSMLVVKVSCIFKYKPGLNV